MLDVEIDAFQEWVSIPAEELTDRSPLPLTIVPTKEDLYEHFAQDMFARMSESRAKDEHLSLIIPIGPKRHFPRVSELINGAGLNLAHVTFFGMDEWLDWQGRPVDWDHPCRLEAYFANHFLNLIEPELRPPPENIIFPSPFDIDRPVSEMAKRPQVDTTYAGFGFQGHIAFNEPPGSRWSPVTLDQLRQSTTRLICLKEDSIIAHAHRSLGGNVFAIPPMAVTLGMRELLAARRLRLYSDGGAWKQTILRILLFSAATVDYPVTLCRDHGDVEIVVDAETAACPPQAW